MRTITMQDIIDKTGFSQGGIYRFDKIFSLEDRLSVREINNSIFNMLSDFMEKELKKNRKNGI